MRKVNFKVRNIGSAKYLSYILDDECDFNEELLDYLDDNKIPELIDIIYEEDDENDYLTYNVTDRVTVESIVSKTVNAEMLLGIIRGITSGIVNMMDLGIPVSYVILHKGFTYVNPVTYDVKLICVPVGSDVNMSVEFRTFIKNIVMSCTYADDEDCNYVAKLINMLNVEKFTIRAFSGQLTELMEAAGMSVEEDFMDVGASGVEVSQSVENVKSDTTMDDLPEFDNVSFDDEDDSLKMYEEEPAAENTIFKDLDLDSGDSSAVSEKTTTSINMDVFDDSVLEELTIDENEEYEFSGDDEKQPEPEQETDEDVATEEAASEHEPVDGIKQATQIKIEEPEFDDSADYTETLISGDAQPKSSYSIKELGRTVDGVTEILAESNEEDKPVLIDTKDMEKIPDKPPVVKNIRVNRAKIIQTAGNEADEEPETIDNPTEQIIGFGSIGEEPETRLDPVADHTEIKETSEGTGSTVELTAGMNVVKDSEPEPEKERAAGIPNAMPYIVRVNTGERVMINKTVFKIGKANRGVDYHISGNGAISKIHAIIYVKDDGCYLQDNKATNSTYVNDHKLEENEEVKLKNDSNIVIGGEDFLFRLS